MQILHVFNYTFWGHFYYKIGQKWNVWLKCRRQTGLTLYICVYIYMSLNIKSASLCRRNEVLIKGKSGAETPGPANSRMKSVMFVGCGAFENVQWPFSLFRKHTVAPIVCHFFTLHARPSTQFQSSIFDARGPSTQPLARAWQKAGKVASIFFFPF